ncbi:hypothetical protein BB561_002265 [Smittium simulii]|uniref:NAD(+) diphosphatase n=1 Tax=Smittium simulii TaxID=133385 RepID=A0A2T9YQX7_9FUNG|nr:hypothetical protein BB561_002265 [Smittium simulii]
MNISKSRQFFSGNDHALDRMGQVRTNRKLLSGLYNDPNTRFLLCVNGGSKFLFLKQEKKPELATSLPNSQSPKRFQQIALLKRQDLLDSKLSLNPYLEENSAVFGKIVIQDLNNKKSVDEYSTAMQFSKKASQVFLGKTTNISAIDSNSETLQETPPYYNIWAIDLGDLGAYEQDKIAEFAENAGIEEPQGIKEIESAIANTLKGIFLPLRTGSFGLNACQAHVIALAAALTDWNYRNQFCPGCGNPTWSTQAGYKRVCVNGLVSTINDNPLLYIPQEIDKKCYSQFSLNNFTFPRTDPVIIVAIISPDGDKLLLARGAKFPPKRYSCIAGFVDAAESIEDAVRREVREEVGLNVDKIEYYTSQPWPFPNSLMIGCFAHATSKNIVVDQDEILDAKWCSVNDIYPSLAKNESESLLNFDKIIDQSNKKTLVSDQTDIELPPAVAVGFFLIQAWIKKQINHANL